MPAGVAATVDLDELAQRLGEYAVQVIALDTLAAIQDFAAKVGGDDPRYVQILGNQDNELYALLIGFYPNRRAAQEAALDWIEQNPSESEPWVRSTASLHRAVKQHIESSQAP